ncbi:MAG: EamA family transporter [Verrucomicrobiia bacterium]
MTPEILMLCVASQLCLVTGQLLLKHTMNQTNLTPMPWQRVIPLFALGISILSGWFFLWGGLLQKTDLSYIYPFEGMGPALMLIGAWLFLKEKLTLQSCIGIGLISVGIALVSAS